MKAITGVAFSIFLLSLSLPLTAARTVPEQLEFAGIQLTLSREARQIIQKSVDQLTASEKYYAVKLERMAMYFPLMERILLEEQVPDDFKFLAMQESGLLPDVVSSSNAVGFWQFKKETATELGLRVDHEVDERMNIISSTRGAARYMKRSQLFTRNWLYSLLSYYTGLGGVRPLVKEQYQGVEKMRIDEDMHWYVLKYLAYLVALRDANLRAVDPPYRLAEFTKGAHMTLRELATTTRTDEDLMKSYNRWLKGVRIPADKVYHTLLPLQKGNAMPLVAMGEVKKQQTDKEAGHYTDTESEAIRNKERAVREQMKHFTVSIDWNGIPAVLATRTYGIFTLASPAGIPRGRFLKHNDLSLSDSVFEGQIYYLKPKKNKATVPYHILQTGETTWEIAQKYGIKLKSLRKKNRLKAAEIPPYGTRLWLRKKRPKHIPPVVLSLPSAMDSVSPLEAPPLEQPLRSGKPPNTTKSQDTSANARENAPATLPTAPAISTTGYHIVAKGETLYGIGRSYAIPLDSIRSWNGLSVENSIQAGQVLKVQPPDNQQKAVESEYLLHKVEAGDTFYNISKRYGQTVLELMQLNGKQDASLFVGEILKVARK